MRVEYVWDSGVVDCCCHCYLCSFPYWLHSYSCGSLGLQLVEKKAREEAKLGKV